MRLVAPLLTAKVDVPIALAAGRRLVAIAAIPGLEALQAGPGFDERAVDREMLRRQQPLDLRLAQDGCQELGCDLAFEQTVAVLREHRMIPSRIIDPETNKPAEQQIELQPLHQLTFRADRVESLQQRGTQQLLRWNRRAAQRRIQRGKVTAQLRQRAICYSSDGSQRMLFRHPRLQIDVGKERS